MDEGSENIIIIVASSVVAFLFGQSGLFQKLTDFVIGKKMARDKLEEDNLLKKDQQIAELTKLVDELKISVNQLEKDLIKTSAYVRTLLAYLETMMPEGSNPFIKEMVKEIRKDDHP